MHFYEGYHFWGMHLLWWVIWVVFLIRIFAVPRAIGGQRSKPERPLDILQRRFAEGSISEEEYDKRKALLKKDGL